MLIKLQNIKSFDMDRFLVLDDFLQMMVYDQRCNPTNSVNKLYVKFLYPLFWQEVGKDDNNNHDCDWINISSYSHELI